jgi:hypothetical protein
MKKMFSLLLAGALLVAGAGFAQQELSVKASFYDGNPNKTGSIIKDDFGQAVQVKLVSNAIGQKIYDIEKALYIRVQFAKETLLFKIFGGDTTNEMTLVATTNTTSDEKGSSISLGEVVAALTKAQSSDQQVAIFNDGDGIVRGFYTFSATNLPTITVDKAKTLTLLGKDSVTTFQTVNPGTVKLENVLVLQNDEYLPLYRSTARANVRSK